MTTIADSVRALNRLVRRLRCGGGHQEQLRQMTPQGCEPEGCEQLIGRILSTLHNNSILLCGGSESVKTALLLHLKDRLSCSGDPSTEFFPVYIDLRGVAEPLLFARVADAVLSQLGGGTPDRAERFGAAYDHRALANDLRRILRMLGRRTTKIARLVLLVDGVDALNHYHPRTTQRVRSLFMASLGGNLVMVATAVAIDKRWEQEGSPWYNFFEEIELPSSGRRARMTGNG